ncbi:MAG: hypothetical protein WB421_05845 [Terriglobales bacterium]
MDAKLKAAPRLKLLLEFEPAHRVFFGNLADTFMRRTAPRVATTSRPGPFWNDVFVYTAMPWRSFFESVLWHVLVVSLVWSLFWRAPQETAQQKLFRDSRIIYYPPSQSFPTVASRRPRVRPQPKPPKTDASQQKIVVTPGRSAHSLILPPDLKLAESAQSDSVASKIAAANPTLPAMPLSATGSSRRAMAPGLVAAVAPSPDVNQTTTRRLGLPQASAVAPAPEVGAASSRRAVGVPSSAVVAPPPTVQGSIRRVGDINIGHSEAVAPAPQLPMSEQRTIPGRAPAGLAGTSAAVVPPPPTVGGSGAIADGRGRPMSTGLQAVPPAPSIGSGNNSTTGRRANSLSAAGAQVVPPTVSVDGAGGSTTGGRASPLSGAGVQAVPPAPSIGGGDSTAGGRRGSLSGAGSGAGTQVVPPSPSLDGAGNSSGGGRANSLSGAAPQVVPPAPSLGNESASGLGGSGNLSTAGMRVVPPSPSVDSAGNSAGSGRPATTDIPQEVASPSAQATAADDHSQPAVQELPVNLIGLVLALPGTSYFSNYEVFVARRRIGKDETALIKLVYEFLPYQRRLSEIGLKNAKVYKLTVVRDTTCDETLMQMLNPQIDESHPGTKYTFDPALLGPNDPNSMLPCYRTTADDFRKALSKAHQ